MNTITKIILTIVVTIFCSACDDPNGGFSADWLIVQVDSDGKPFRCWDISNAGITKDYNGSISWIARSHSKNGDELLRHEIIITQPYYMISIGSPEDREAAFAELGLTSKVCEQINKMRYNPIKHVYE